ncbi:hypothetical protein H477_0657 [[Clostridium] sordellii ATCC 9714]|nr:hypothetical protein H477_0657 [[Clostridium] sordellii ATCC 9714] [Paeniclostridium sordellii ATCC 9714]
MNNLRKRFEIKIKGGVIMGAIMKFMDKYIIPVAGKLVHRDI